jgi:hypothetical protein
LFQKIFEFLAENPAGYPIPGLTGYPAFGLAGYPAKSVYGASKLFTSVPVMNFQTSFSTDNVIKETRQIYDTVSS